MLHMKDQQQIAHVNVVMNNHSYCNTCLLLQTYLYIDVVIKYYCSRTNFVCEKNSPPKHLEFWTVKWITQHIVRLIKPLQDNISFNLLPNILSNKAWHMFITINYVNICFALNDLVGYFLQLWLITNVHFKTARTNKVHERGSWWQCNL